MAKRSSYGYGGELEFPELWNSKFYDVKMFSYPYCGGIFNYYTGTSPRSKRLSSFTCEIKPRYTEKAKI